MAKVCKAEYEKCCGRCIDFIRPFEYGSVYGRCLQFKGDESIKAWYGKACPLYERKPRGMKRLTAKEIKARGGVVIRKGQA